MAHNLESVLNILIDRHSPTIARDDTLIYDLDHKLIKINLAAKTVNFFNEVHGTFKLPQVFVVSFRHELNKFEEHRAAKVSQIRQNILNTVFEAVADTKESTNDQ